jgi:hypothetical protein
LDNEFDCKGWNWVDGGKSLRAVTMVLGGMTAWPIYIVETSCGSARAVRAFRLTWHADVCNRLLAPRQGQTDNHYFYSIGASITQCHHVLSYKWLPSIASTDTTVERYICFMALALNALTFLPSARDGTYVA